MARSNKNQSKDKYVTHRHWAVFLLRIGLGWMFTYAGWSKVITFYTPEKDWTAAGFLKGTLEGPFSDFFAPMIANPIVDYLNAYGLLLIGIAVLLGAFVRWTAWWGGVLMFLYWLAVFPPEHSFLVDDHIIYMLAFIVLATVDAGRTWGVDAYLEKTGFVNKHPIFKLLLG